MGQHLQIEAHWERLEHGAPEERATYAGLGIHVGDRWATEVDDVLAGRTGRHVYLPAYRLAEWLTWNWWRLRWEPFRSTQSWRLAHNMAAIGGGWIWPNAAVITDGNHVILRPIPTLPRSSEPLRYLSSLPLLVTAHDFEAAIDNFVIRVLDQLRGSELGATNLRDLWDELIAERSDPKLSRFRKLEALLGWDPGEADDALIEQLEADSEELGIGAVEELAANGAGERAPLGRAELMEIAGREGIGARLGDAATLGHGYQGPDPQTLSWWRGVHAATALRAADKLGDDVVTDDRLCEMAGVMRGATDRRIGGVPISFELNPSVIVLRSGSGSARRFDLARILGDRNMERTEESLRPITRGRTDRQNAQIGFAAELLCPVEALKTFLADDLTEETYDDAADRFGVSTDIVRMQLLANHILGRRDDQRSWE
ncbi:hypothetical protein [Sphingomonas sp. dw_22]|uniref:ImmA/IrrE family metallo-endopeptidase n=1 Tax=Sphingomonas sp. dw_22 TaxID=2721175 RepID=UPI001BD6C9DB|nr:hypothetical protein [Sphingomonas sp. dw_22]